MSKLRDEEVVRFLWKNIICWFNLPKEIITNNRKQLIGSKVKAFVQNYKVSFVISPYITHKRTNK